MLTADVVWLVAYRAALPQALRGAGGLTRKRLELGSKTAAQLAADAVDSARRACVLLERDPCTDAGRALAGHIWLEVHSAALPLCLELAQGFNTNGREVSDAAERLAAVALEDAVRAGVLADPDQSRTEWVET